MIKGVVFDMDGLMFDTERLAMEGWEYAGRQTGVRIGRALLLKTRGLNAEGTKRVFLERFGGGLRYEPLRALRLRRKTACPSNRG